MPQLALLQGARFDGGNAIDGSVGSVRAGLEIEPQLCLSVFLVLAVTSEASTGKNGPYVSVEGYFVALENMMYGEGHASCKDDGQQLFHYAEITLVALLLSIGRPFSGSFFDHCLRVVISHFVLKMFSCIPSVSSVDNLCIIRKNT